MVCILMDGSLGGGGPRLPTGVEHDPFGLGIVCSQAFSWFVFPDAYGEWDLAWVDGKEQFLVVLFFG